MAPTIPQRKRKPTTKQGDVVANADGSPMDEEQDSRRAVIERRVDGLIRDAIMHRESSGIEEVWREDEDQYNGLDPANPNVAGTHVKPTASAARTAVAGTRASVYLNITEPKTDTAVARVQEMLVPHDEKPWDIAPTPVPDLDEAIAGEDQTPVTLGDGNQVPRVDAAKALKKKADDSAKEMGDWVEDRFVEGSVYAEMRQVIRDAGRLGTGCLKGPFPVAKRDRKWSLEGGVSQIIISERIAPTSRRIRIQDCFPAPDCGNSIHDGSYFVERDYLTARKLRDLAGLPDYDREAIAAALREGPQVPSRDRNSNRTQMVGEATISDSMLFEVFYVYLELAPEDMVELGVDRGREGKDSLLDDTEMQLLSVSAVATMLNGRAIKVSLNPMETGCFPYDFFCWKKVDGQPWGRGVPNKMGVSQRGLNAGVRALMENAGLSSGPIVVYRQGAIKPAGGGKYEVKGRSMFEFTPSPEGDQDVNKAFAIFNIPSMQQQLLEIIKFWLEMADILTNLPMLLQGIAEAGTSPETLGGMRMLLDNATAPLRVIAKQYDDDLIVPHLRRYYDYGMQDPDVPESAKGDHEIKAKGATVLVQRAEARELLQMLIPVKDDPAFKLNPAKLIAEFAKSQGYNLSTVQYTDEEWRAEEEKRAQQGAPVDPRIQAAQIRNEGLMAVQQEREKSLAAEREWKAAQAEATRAFDEAMKQIDQNIEMMRMSSSENISLQQIKAMLAETAMKLRSSRDEMSLKLTPQNQSGTGI